MERDKLVAKHYLKTGILGAYETTVAESEKISDERYAPRFDDTIVDCSLEQTQAVRTMCIDDRRFRVHSLFLGSAEISPTDKLLTLIDRELEKEVRTT